jgi:zinc and cadmium transporter
MMAKVLLAALFVGPGSVVLASLVLGISEETLRRLTPRVVSFAVGAILGMVFLRMLPHALEYAPVHAVLATVLVGILAMFLLERFRLLRHCHEFNCQDHVEMPTRIFLGNASHALVDGIALAVAFQSSASTGWVLVLALLGHEIPKSVVSLVLLKEGRGNGAAFLWNLFPSLFTLVGALLALTGMHFLGAFIPYVMASGSAFFLYLALADLVPKHRRNTRSADAFWQAALVLAGAALIFGLPHHH